MKVKSIYFKRMGQAKNLMILLMLFTTAGIFGTDSQQIDRHRNTCLKQRNITIFFERFIAPFYYIDEWGRLHKLYFDTDSLSNINMVIKAVIQIPCTKIFMFSYKRDL